MAIIKPPIYRKTYLCPKAAVVVTRSRLPNNGNNTIGKSAVAAIGMASVIHQNAIHMVAAKVVCPAVERPSNSNKN